MIHVENKIIFTLPFAQHKWKYIYTVKKLILSHAWTNIKSMHKIWGKKLEKNHIRHEVETGCNKKEGVWTLSLWVSDNLMNWLKTGHPTITSAPSYVLAQSDSMAMTKSNGLLYYLITPAWMATEDLNQWSEQPRPRMCYKWKNESKLVLCHWSRSHD